MKQFSRLVEVVKTLRSPQGCAWDRKQKIKDLENYILEETYELIEAIDNKDYSKIKEEIGDLFLLLVFFSFLFEEKKLFSLDGVLEGIVSKMIARHPHVFSNKKVKTSKTVLNRWIKNKSRKKKRKTVYERIPRTSPSLFSSYLFLRELKVLNSPKFKDFESKLSESFSKFKKRRRKEHLLDLIFYSACLLSFKKNNPEIMLKKKVNKEALAVSYGLKYRKSK